MPTRRGRVDKYGSISPVATGYHVPTVLVAQHSKEDTLCLNGSLPNRNLRTASATYSKSTRLRQSSSWRRRNDSMSRGWVNGLPSRTFQIG
jgi:hypothetical protein